MAVVIGNFRFPMISCFFITPDINAFIQGDQLSGKPGNIREFDSCQGFY